MKNKTQIVFIPLLLLLTLLACGGLGVSSQPQPPAPTKPTAVINFPRADSKLTLGQPIVVQSASADIKGVIRVELWIDNQLLETQNVSPPVNSYSASHTWLPETSGSHVVEIRAYNVDNLVNDPTQVIVTIAQAEAAATEPTATDTPPLPPTAAATDTPPPPAEATPTWTPEPATPAQATAVVVAQALFVRAGPGTSYAELGKLSQGDTAVITGKNTDGSWWQVAYPANTDGRGWIAADAQYTTATSAEGVPIAQAPALPTFTPAPPTNTPAPQPTDTPVPTNTPVSSGPTIHYFRAERTTINRGESVILNWDLTGAKEAFLRYNDKTEGVVAPGSKTVSPETNTTYTLLARSDLGDTTKELTITVNEPASSDSVLKQASTILFDADFMDFDWATIRTPYFHGADFLWSGPSRQLQTQGEAKLVILRYNYVPDFNAVNRAECIDVMSRTSNDVALADPRSGDVACYRTNEGRYGKLVVNNVVAIPGTNTTKLEFTWLTWN